MYNNNVIKKGIYMEKDIHFKLAGYDVLDEVGMIYERIHEDLSQTVNYPRWPRGIYPTEESAQEAIDKNELYILKDHQQIIGLVILNQEQDLGYENVDWQVEAKDYEVMVIHTLAIDPRFKGKGYAGIMIQKIKQFAVQKHCLALRLDLTQGNVPARNLYQKHGFYFTGIADLHRQSAGIDYSEMFEYNLKKPHDQLESIEKVIDDFVRERDWHQYHTADNLAKSIIIEAAELLECFQWDDDYDKEHVYEELADVMIYSFQLAEFFDVDVKEMICSKMKKNRLKYPVEN